MFLEQETQKVHIMGNTNTNAMKTVLVTGANKGIGFETARQMARMGYFVFLGCRNRDRGLDAVNELKQSGLSNVELIVIDVCDQGSIEQARATLESFVTSLDILINNAAITGGQPQEISTCEPMTLRQVFETNYFGVVQTTQQLIPLLRKSGGPVIVNVSSEVGSLTMQTSQDRNPNWDLFSLYGSSKVALNSFTVTLSNELRDTNFRVFSVTPGYTATDLNQHQGIKTVEEGASTIVKYATSQNSANGGFYREEGLVSW